MRVAQPIVVNEQTRRKLEQQTRGRSTPARAVVRSRIVLLAAEGMLNKQIAKTLRVTPRMVTLWRGRFLDLGIEGLLKDAPRPGRTPAITSQMTATLIAKTTQSMPANATQWSTRTMAKEMCISKASVSRIWRANGLKPHRVESFKVSNDPHFVDKLEAIVGLYLKRRRALLESTPPKNSQLQTHLSDGSGGGAGDGFASTLLRETSVDRLVAVGTSLAARPPRRSVQAELPHTALAKGWM
jgi:transposase